jgi:hypothetical protein
MVHKWCETIEGWAEQVEPETPIPADFVRAMQRLVRVAAVFTPAT